MVADEAAITPLAGAGGEGMLRARRIELHGRVAAGTVLDRPVLDLAATLAGFAAPALHPMARKPFDLTATGVLRGLDNLRPLPIPARLRQLQTAGGRLEIKHARLQQGNLTAVAVGSLGLTPGGRLDGELTVTVTGIEHVLPQLGIDLSTATNTLAPALGMLDRLAPALGRAARDSAGTGLAMGLSLIGKPAELEGRKALALPLRFADGAVYLGPLRVGAVAPLY
jgi:hypothetical protein